MQELIERLERATEGSLELDCEIALAIGWTQGHVGSEKCWYDPDSRLRALPDKYTRSLDAARTLVPEGYIWACAIERIYHDDDVSYEPDGKLVAYAEVKPDKVDSSIYRLHEIIEAQALTPELALCVAALEARS